jgi:ribosome-associated protein
LPKNTFAQGRFNPLDLKNLIETILDDNKATDIEVINLQGLSSLADYMIICSGSSSRQVVALSEKIKEKMVELGLNPPRSEGTHTGDWVVVDAFDVLVHIFRPEVRSFYNIEKMWRPHLLEPDKNSVRSTSPDQMALA